MIFQLQISDLPLLLDLKRQQLAEAGRIRLPPGWRQNALDRYDRLYREGRCQHVVWRADSPVVAIAGAVFIDDAPFLASRIKRYALLVDEYVSPEFRGLGLEGQLRDALLKIIAGRDAILQAQPPPNFARLSAASAGCVRF